MIVSYNLHYDNQYEYKNVPHEKCIFLPPLLQVLQVSRQYLDMK